MNVLMISFVVNIGVGLVVFAITSDQFFYTAFEYYTKFLGDWFNLMV